MKQKNLILMVVAVACGLLAAFLTSRMSARPAAAPQQIEVLMVAKELAPGTKFTADSIKDQFKKKSINPDAIPERAVFTVEELDGKTLNKTLRMDDFVREGDLGNYQPLIAPEGKHIVTVRLAVDKMTPFIQPNNRVDILGTKIDSEGQVSSDIIIPNVLVMAVDTRIAAKSGSPDGDMAIQLASVAASREEAQAIRICEAANVKLSFILRTEQESATGSDPNWKLSKVVDWVNGRNAQVVSNSEERRPSPEADPKETTTRISVPVSDLPAGTELTVDVLEAKFKEVNLLGEPPANAVTDIKAHVGRYLTKDVAADQFVPKHYLSDKSPQVAELPRGKANNEGVVPQEKGGTPDLPEVVKLPTFDRSYTTPQGTKVYRYEVPEGGLPRLLGEVTPEGAVVPAQNVPPTPTPTPKDETPPQKKDI